MWPCPPKNDALVNVDWILQQAQNLYNVELKKKVLFLCQHIFHHHNDASTYFTGQKYVIWLYVTSKKYERIIFLLPVY